MTDFDSRLGTALHDRVADERPDLDRLVATSARAGTRIRRRRQLGVTAAAAAGVAAIGVFATQVGGGPGTTSADTGFAGGDTSATVSHDPKPTQDEIATLCADQPTGTVLLRLDGTDTWTPTRSPVTAGDGETGQVLRCVDTPAKLADRAASTEQGLPVHHDALPGWTFGAAGDDKFPATKGSYAVSVNVRSLDEWAAWSGADPDRPSSQVAHKGDNYFVTVQPGPGVPQKVVDELIAGLRFDAAWAGH